MTTCEQCGAHGIITPATKRAEWIDAEGVSDGGSHDVCRECLDAGNHQGPGYKEIETKRVQIVNPWSGAFAPGFNLTWEEIGTWAEKHIHTSDMAEWLKEAKKAFALDDGETLGKMIIGS